MYNKSGKDVTNKVILIANIKQSKMSMSNIDKNKEFL